MNYLETGSVPENLPPVMLACNAVNEELVTKLNGNLKPVLKALFPAGKIVKYKFLIGDCQGNAGDSLNVELAGEKAGLWYDFATSEGGNILQLIAAHHELDAIADSDQLVGIVDDLLSTPEITDYTEEVLEIKSGKPSGLGTPTAHWDYKDFEGNVVATVFRYDPPSQKKQIRPFDPVNKKWCAPAEPRPLYNKPGIAASDVVIVVEGEKSAQALIDQGHCATTAMFGANAPVEKTDWSPLFGKVVEIWPDNDEPGLAYANAVAQAALDADARAVLIYQPPEGKPQGWDVADALLETDPPFDLEGFLIGGETVPVLRPRESTLPFDIFKGLDWSTEDGLASGYTRYFGDDDLYCAEMGKWLKWSGNRWVPDRTQSVQYQSRQVCRTAAARAEKPAQKAKLSSAGTISAVERLARSDPKHATTTDDWDADLWQINTPGGMVNLQTGEVVPHKREFRVTKITTATPSGNCPRWKQFLNEVTGEDVELVSYLQRVVGYCLTGVTVEHALFFLYGTGANGKSIFVSAISSLLGDYATIAPMETFMQTRSDRHPTDLAGLRGARFVASTETEQGARWAESKIKQLTGGDKITARFMRQDFFQYSPQFKLVIAGNHKPAIRNVDLAMRRRLHLIPFTVTIPPENRDKGLLEKLLAERDGIMAWALEGCLVWQKIGLAQPQAVIDATDEYFETEDAIGQWIDANCELGTSKRALTKDLFTNWSTWAENNGEYAGSVRKFSDQLASRHFELIRFSGGDRGFVGICLRSVILKAMNFNA